MTVDGKSLWRIFPGLDPLAYYDPIGNYICLNNLSFSQFKDVHKNPSAYPVERSILMHEFQHWIDHIGTLWGQKKLQKLFRAFDSVIRRDEHLLYRMKEAMDDFKRDRLFDYYTETGRPIQGDVARRWRYQLSAGARFTAEGKVSPDHSIVFVRFYSYKDEFISRVPLSVASLLETIARRMEIETRLLYINQLKPPFRMMELKLLSDELANYIYNPNLTLYSVAAHACSNTLHITDPVVGYRVASAVATLALNFPAAFLKDLKIPAEFENWGNNYSQNMIAQQEHGFIYLCLLKNYTDANGNYDPDKFNVEAVLQSSGLPGLKDFETAVEEESKSIGEAVALEQNIFTNVVFDKIFTGNKIRKLRGIGLEKEGAGTAFLADTKERPYFLCNDQLILTDGIDFGEVIQKIVHVQPITQAEWWCVWETCEQKINLFNEICGI